MITGAPLQIKQYFFPHVEITADPQYKPTKKPINPFFNVKTHVDRDPKNELYQVVLEITVEAENDKILIPYSIHLIAVGLFHVHPDFTEPEKLLSITGASIIYSAAREFIITITSRGPWPKFILPTISFAPRQQSSDKAPKKKRVKPKISTKKSQNQ
jgi:preprotein translocase subunit SecB